jgi:hypothetical protein
MKITGLKSAKRLFAGNSPSDVRNETLTERLLPYETCTYEISLAGETVRIEVTSALDEKGPRETVANVGEMVDKMRKSGKNYVFNPTFNIGRGNELFPTYWHPLQSQMLDVGKVGSGWYLDDKNPWGGYPSLKVSNMKVPGGYRNLLASAGKIFLPDSKSPQKCTVSFYAKADTDGKRIRIFSNGKAAVFSLTTDWRRYHTTWDMNYDKYGNPLLIYAYDENMSMWISGIQAEKGGSMTDFQNDTVEKTLSRVKPNTGI